MTLSILLALSFAAAPTVELRWKLKPDEVLRYQYTQESLRPPEKNPAPSEHGHFEDPVKSRRELQIRAAGADRLAVTLLVGDLVWAPMRKNATAAEKKRRAALTQPAGTVQNQTTVNTAGFVEAPMPREARNQFVILMELPARPVAVGDKWSLSADLVKFEGDDLVETEHELVNDAVLTALEGTGNDQLAIIDFKITERGVATVRERGKPPGMLDMKFGAQGHGEFWVAKGRWKKQSWSFEGRATGLMTFSAQTRDELTPLP